MWAEALLLVAVGTFLVLVIMFELWRIHIRAQNAGIVDVGWALGLGLLALLFAAAGSGDPVKRVAVAVMGGGWAFRLAWHLFTRMKGKPEEGRYQALRREWTAAGHDVPRRFLWFFLFQGVLDVVLSLPFLFPALDPERELSPFAWAGLTLFVLSITGETFADRQLSAFKRDPANQGRVCDVGLWRYSRHPNYFFEWLIWCSFALFAMGSPWGGLGLLSPVLILYFLLKVTGIPPTEAQALRSRPEAYRRYQDTTSAFFPWFPKKG